MNILATITNGYGLRDSNLTHKEIENLEERIANNSITEDELLKLGFKPVHYEGIAWTEND